MMNFKKQMKFKMIFYFSSILILISSLSIYYRQKSYVVVNPKMGRITEAVYGLGKIKSVRSYDLVVGVLLPVKKIFVHEGQFVKQEDPLIMFESSIGRAPFSGVVTSINIDEGETALPMISLLKLEDIKNRYIEVSLEQEAALKVKKGQIVKISLESLSQLILKGVVEFIFPRNEEFIVHIQVQDLQKNILPGMTADVSIEIGSISDALMIPVKAISNGMISLKRGKRWVKEKVEIGHVDGLFAEIIHPKLNERDQIRIKRR